jgi:hypothetical protein
MASTPRAVLLLFLLAPLAARAQTSPDATPPDTAPQEALQRAVTPPEPTPPARVEAPARAEAPPRAADARRWSLGAGVGFGVSVVSSTVSPDGLFLLGGSAPTASASLERELSPRSWLVLGVNGAITRQSSEMVAGTSYDQDLVLAAASIGVRNVVTPSGAPVDFSTVLLAEGGFAHAGLSPEPPSGAHALRSWRIGASFGIAVDRELTTGLSLRVATPLVQAAYSSERVEYVGGPPTRMSGFGVGVVVAPRLELRIAY